MNHLPLMVVLNEGFGKLQLRLNGNFAYNKFNQFINNQRSINENYSQTYRARLRTNFREAPNVSLSYGYTINDNDLGATRTKFYTNAPAVEFDAYIWKTLTFLTNFSYTRFSNEDSTLNEYRVWDASLNYRKNKDSKWEYEIKATNLLDTDSENTTSTSAISVSATEYFIQPRFISFRLKYNL